MNINICDHLKELRKKKNNTQEELAEFLIVSVSAVSKWERGECYPDIELLPQIAMYYNTSVDDLLGVGKIQIEKKVAEYYEKSDAYQRKGDFDNNLALWTEAIQKFPNHCGVMNGYMGALYMKNQSCINPEEYSDEIIKIAERLFKESDEPRHRYDVIWNLCRLYARLGNEEKAIEYARKAPIIDITEDHLLSIILKGDKAVECIQDNLRIYADLIYGGINNMLKQGNFTNNEKRKARQYSLKVFELLYEDGDYGFYCTRISSIHGELAVYDAADKNLDGVINNLTLATEYAIKFLTQKGFKRTSFLVNRSYHEEGFQGYPNGTDNDCREILNIMKQDQFDFCREDERFKEIEKKLEEYAN